MPVVGAIGKIGMTRVGRFSDTSDPEQSSRYTVSDVTRDVNLVAVGGCTVLLFETATNIFRGATVSDSAGRFNIEVAGDRTITFFYVAYKVGSPDIFGTTINTLLAT